MISGIHDRQKMTVYFAMPILWNHFFTLFMRLGLDSSWQVLQVLPETVDATGFSPVAPTVWILWIALYIWIEIMLWGADRGRGVQLFRVCSRLIAVPFRFHSHNHLSVISHCILTSGQSGIQLPPFIAKIFAYE